MWCILLIYMWAHLDTTRKTSSFFRRPKTMVPGRGTVLLGANDCKAQSPANKNHRRKQKKNRCHRGWGRRHASSAKSGGRERQRHALAPPAGSRREGTGRAPPRPSARSGGREPMPPSLLPPSSPDLGGRNSHRPLPPPPDLGGGTAAATSSLPLRRIWDGGAPGWGALRWVGADDDPATDPTADPTVSAPPRRLRGEVR